MSAPRIFVNNPNRDCQRILGSVERGVVAACYVPAAQVVLLPRDCDESKGRIGSSCRALIEHEDCHAQGYVHPSNGRGWVRRDQ